MSPTENERTTVTSQLADYFTANREAIINEWCERMAADPALPTDRLSERALIDHLPRIFSDLTQTLRRDGSTAVAAQSDRDAEKHAEERWKQGFSLTNLLREFHHLRAVLTDHLMLFEKLHADFAQAQRVFALSTVNGFLDAVMTEGCEQYVAGQNTAFGATANGTAPEQSAES
jgi:RsbT co-antagonist protein rsbRD N-terminal domain